MTQGRGSVRKLTASCTPLRLLKGASDMRMLRAGGEEVMEAENKDMSKVADQRVCLLVTATRRGW